jgi:magnesium transporter
VDIVEFTEGTLRFLDSVPAAAPQHGFVWIFLERQALAGSQGALQDAARRLGGSPLLDLHLKDLANAAHPSHYDYTSVYDLVVFRRLATSAELGETTPSDGRTGTELPLASFRRIRTEAISFAVFDRLLVSVHPAGCQSARAFIQRYADDAVHNEGLLMVARSRLPSSPADLMLRMINGVVDGYLDLRRQLAAELTQWQEQLLQPRNQAADWKALMLARAELHQLEDLCEAQHDAMQEWRDTLREQPQPQLTPAEREALVARGNDVIEHILRVVQQVRRMEQGAEAAVQIHFSAQSHRTNNIMRTLTALTAIFLPLNLVTGIFGMNFEQMPLLQQAGGFWWTAAGMALLALVLGGLFWRKRYLSRSR